MGVPDPPQVESVERRFRDPPRPLREGPDRRGREEARDGEARADEAGGSDASEEEERSPRHRSHGPMLYSRSPRRATR
jgi:hypothetical protein